MQSPWLPYDRKMKEKLSMQMQCFQCPKCHGIQMARSESEIVAGAKCKSCHRKMRVIVVQQVELELNFGEQMQPSLQLIDDGPPVG